MRDALLVMAGIPCLTAVGFCLFSILSAALFFSKKRETGADFLPPVSILKSVRGVDKGTQENLASFCRQDYPDYQVLFGVHDPEDPVIPLIRRLMQQFPDRDIGLTLCGRTAGMNPKMSNLAQMEGQAKHPFILVCDSDIRVGKDYLRRLVRPMRDPRVGAVTCMCHSLSKGWIGTLEALREVTEFCPNVLVANQLEGIQFGLGAAILARKEAIQRIGGFASIADYLADDYLLGNRIARAGYKVLLSNVVVEHELSLVRWRDLIRRRIRWNRGIRACRPAGYRGLFLTFGVPMSALFLAAARFSAAGWAVLAATWSSRLVMARVIGVRYFNDRAARRYLWMIPLNDLLSFGLWFAGFFGNKIYWRGQVFQLTREGKLKPILKPGPVPVRDYDDSPLVATPQ